LVAAAWPNAKPAMTVIATRRASTFFTISSLSAPPEKDPYGPAPTVRRSKPITSDNQKLQSLIAFL
jgi:hypothetical protein